MSPAGIEPTFAGARSLELNPLRAIAKFKMLLGAIPADPFDRVAEERISQISSKLRFAVPVEPF